MAAIVPASLIFFFLLPSFSISCTPTLPCNQSIEVKPPFYLQSDSTKDPSCQAYFPIGCYNDNPYLLWRDLSLPIESISYQTNILRLQLPQLSSSLNRSGCGNLYFNFSTPVDNIQTTMYLSMNASLSSVRCYPSNQIKSPPKVFGKDYNLSYSPSLEGNNKPVQNCSRPENSDPTFEHVLSFRNDSKHVSLISASYSNDLAAQTGCFANSLEVFDCDGCKGGGFRSHKRVILLVSTIAGTIIIAIVLLLLIAITRRYGSSRKSKVQEQIEVIIKQHGSFAPKRYRYAELKKLTNSFRDELGKGGFGRVFKGSLRNGCPAAVKLLHDSSSTGEEFVNEVISISRTSHVNIVGLLGFCIDKSNRALIYEYMPNGSLDKYIYSENHRTNLGWEKLYEIAVGVARGLDYLHQGCNTRIVHFDIKPQNILLDEDFCPRIADFGLAKLCPPKKSILSLAQMRGTIGYIAPEVFSRSFGVVSTKSDVYSYGMMLLDMVGGRRNSKPCVGNSSQATIPQMVYDCVVKGAEIELFEVTIETEEIARKMALIGLWCTQTNPANRPSMARVMEMFERSLDELDMPPKPYLSSPPHRMVASTCEAPFHEDSSPSSFFDEITVDDNANNLIGTTN